MSDAADTSVARHDTQGLNSPAAEAADRCIRCQIDLSGDRRTARFCPRCGARRVAIADASPPTEILNELPEAERTNAARAAAVPPPMPPAMPTASQAAAWLQLRTTQPGGGTPADGSFGPAPSRDDDVHSLMLLGYANAMYRLGWRYETGMGSGHNPQEALRCYFKAAKLGNIAALTRLAPQCVAAPNPPPAIGNPPCGGAPDGPGTVNSPRDF